MVSSVPVNILIFNLENKNFVISHKQKITIFFRKTGVTRISRERSSRTFLANRFPQFIILKILHETSSEIFWEMEITNFREMNFLEISGIGYSDSSISRKMDSQYYGKRILSIQKAPRDVLRTPNNIRNSDVFYVLAKRLQILGNYFISRKRYC